MTKMVGANKNKMNTMYEGNITNNIEFLKDFHNIGKSENLLCKIEYIKEVNRCCDLIEMIESDVDNVTQMWLDGVIW